MSTVEIRCQPHVRTTLLDEPAELVDQLPQRDAVAWIRQGEGLAGWGEAARIEIRAGEGGLRTAGGRLADLFAELSVEDPVGVPASGPVAFGSFAFDEASADSVLIVPQVLYGRFAGGSWRTAFGNDSPPAAPSARPVRVLRWREGVQSGEQWRQTVAAAVRRLRAGAARKVVLARDLLAEADGPIDPRLLVRRLSRRYPECYLFVVDRLVGATPELLISRRGPWVESLVIAGTAARGATPAQDAAQAQRLLNSAKDQQEHAYAADMVRSALSPLCTQLLAPASPELLFLRNVIHLVTPLRGRLKEPRTALDLVAALHPTPGVCGTPTDEAMSLIRELEPMDRRRYSGPVGWMDARGDGDWGLALRCAELDGTRARLFAGCGILADSDPEAEWAESNSKFRVMREALEDA